MADHLRVGLVQDEVVDCFHRPAGGIECGPQTAGDFAQGEGEDLGSIHEQARRPVWMAHRPALRRQVGSAGTVTAEVEDHRRRGTVQFQGGRGGAVRGEAAPESLVLSVEDMLARAEEARDQGAAEVRVEWPEGTDHPTEVWIDRDERMVDEELGWTISRVDVLD